MLNRTCAACGGVLQRGSGNTAVCMKCFRTYKMDTPRVTAPDRMNKPELDKDARMGLIVIFAFLAVVFAGLGLFPLVSVAIFAIVRQCVEISKMQDTAQQNNGKVRSIPTGEYLRNRSDYIRRLRELPLGQMPLGIYGERAAEQIERLEVKQRGLRDMLGREHPFVRSAEEAEGYILNNCRKILWRLKFCDQTDPDFCRIHAEYMHSVLAANEKVLDDYEKLLIEVSQIDETPRALPTLDVLAETLRQVRTGEQPEEAIYQQYEREYSRAEQHNTMGRRMMMR